jgi:hypothetical protein
MELENRENGKLEIVKVLHILWEFYLSDDFLRVTARGLLLGWVFRELYLRIYPYFGSF